MVVILADQKTVTLEGARAEGDALWLAPKDAEAVTGWTLKPEGFCKGDACVPVPPGRKAEFVGDDEVNIAALWRHMGQPLVRDSTGAIWSLGTSAAQRAGQLDSLEAPDFTLPDLAGQFHALSSYRGNKVLVLSWASW